MPVPERPPRLGLLQSFNWAIAGVVWALRHERNMQVHVAAAVAVVIASLFFSVSRVELLLVLGAITFVIVAELFNTAVEEIVDHLVEGHRREAKIAKDVAAGAVLIASMNALAVAYLVFYDDIVNWPYRILYGLRISDIDLIVAGLALVLLIVITVKAATRQRFYLRGGWPSGHAAVAFAAWVAVTALAVRTAYAAPISAVALVMAFLTAQSRVQTGAHNTLQVIAGALLGTLVMLVVMGVFHPF